MVMVMIIIFMFIIMIIITISSSNMIVRADVVEKLAGAARHVYVYVA